MELRENPVFGRKIFFINPSFLVESYIIDYLKKNEYEVYILTDYRMAKGVLAANNDSLCFVNIDSEMPYAHWYNFMKSFEQRADLASIYLGVISETASWEDKDKFIMNIKLPGGFHLIDKKTTRLLEDFTKILDFNGAKGRRKYLRLDTRNEHDVSGYLASGGKLFSLNIKDISSAGFAVTYKQNIANLFQKNTLVRNLNISVGRKSMVCSCIVFNTQLLEDGTAMSVLMLTNENPESTRTYIRDYIFEKNSQKLEMMLKGVDRDTGVYTDLEEYKSLKAVANRDYDGIEVLTDAEPLDEV
ncbi:MAG: hypothetical protein K5786_08395 [Treponema sp.]|nr:hypothetical protein [Treponema sp.]